MIATACCRVYLSLAARRGCPLTAGRVVQSRCEKASMSTSKKTDGRITDMLRAVRSHTTPAQLVLISAAYYLPNDEVSLRQSGAHLLSDRLEAREQPP